MCGDSSSGRSSIGSARWWRCWTRGINSTHAFHWLHTRYSLVGTGANGLNCAYASNNNGCLIVSTFVSIFFVVAAATAAAAGMEEAQRNGIYLTCQCGHCQWDLLLHTHTLFATIQEYNKNVFCMSWLNGKQIVFIFIAPIRNCFKNSLSLNYERVESEFRANCCSNGKMSCGWMRLSFIWLRHRQRCKIMDESDTSFLYFHFDVFYVGKFSVIQLISAIPLNSLCLQCCRCR